jgi:hypothetical protein
MGWLYSPHVNLKNVWRATSLFAVAVFAAFATGCGGIGASGSVSPATFLLPGLGHTVPAKNRAPNSIKAVEGMTTPVMIASSASLAN